MSLPPGPRRPALLQSWNWATRPLEFLDRCARRYGTPFTLRFVGGRSYVVVSDPESVKQVFTGSPDVYQAGVAQSLLRSVFGEHSLLVLDGAQHKRHRRLMASAFRGERMRVYTDMTRDLTLADMERWPRGKPFDIHESMRTITLELIVAAVFGRRDPARAEQLLRSFTELASQRNPLLGYIPALQVDLGPWSPWGRSLRIRARFDALMYEEIADARRSHEGRDDVLAKIVAGSEDRGEPLSDQELRDELLTLLAAGHETTAASLAWNLLFILGTPQVLEKVVRELAEVVGTERVTSEHVKRLDYLSAVVNEVFRLRSPTIVAARTLSEPVNLAGYDLPQGTSVYTCGYLAHRRPETYPDPDAFRPERFLESRPGPFTHFPFGGGTRLCLGMPLATFQIKIVLATVLANLRLRLARPLDLSACRDGLVMSPARGAHVVVGSL